MILDTFNRGRGRPRKPVSRRAQHQVDRGVLRHQLDDRTEGVGQGDLRPSRRYAEHPGGRRDGQLSRTTPSLRPRVRP
jgi:hypothetical protein